MEQLDVLRNLIWNLQFDEAERSLKEKKDTEVEYALHYAEIQILRALLAEDTHSIEEAFVRLNHLEHLVSQILSSFTNQQKLFQLKSQAKIQIKPLDPARHYFLTTLRSEIYLLYAGLYFRSGSYVKGSYNLRRSWKSYESAAIMTANIDNNAMSCLKFGLGLFYFFISLVPAKFLWIIEAIGFQANRELGIKYLNECWEGQGYRAPLALLLLIWINRFFLEEMNESEKLIEIAKKHFPSGGLYLYLAGYVYRKKGELDVSIATFQKVYDCSSQIKQLQIASLYESGWSFYLLQKWDKAIIYFENFLIENKTPSFRAFCAYQLGVCYEFVGNREKALESFEKVPDWVRKHFTYDQYAGRKSREYVKSKGITQTEQTLLLASIQLEANQFAKGLETLKTLHSDFEIIKNKPASKGDAYVENLATYFYLKAALLRNVQQLDEAINYIHKLNEISSLVEREIYVVPHAYCELGEILLEQGKPMEAKEQFKKAKEYFDFDFDKPLIRRIENSLDKIKKMSTSLAATTMLKPTVSPLSPNSIRPVIPNSDSYTETEDSSCYSDEEDAGPSKSFSVIETFSSSNFEDLPPNMLSKSAEKSEEKISLSSSSSNSLSSFDNKSFSSFEPKSLQFPKFDLSGSDPIDEFRHKREYLDKLDELVQQIRDKETGLVIKDRTYHLKTYKKCFVGEEAVKWFMKNMEGVDRAQAMVIGEQLMEAKIIHHVVHQQPFRNAYYFYRFQEDEDVPALNMKRIWTLPSRPNTAVLNDIVVRIYDMFQYSLSDDGKRINMSVLAASSEFRQFSMATAELQKVDVTTLNSKEKLAFFINVYNMLVIHAHVVFGIPTSSMQRYQFYNNSKYQIGGQLYSLNEIEHGLLRGNQPPPGSFMKPFSSGDPRVSHVLTSKDPRIHFCLNYVSKTNPALDMFSFENIDGALDFTAENFIDEDVTIDVEKRQIRLSKIFSWYKSDFGKSQKDVLFYISKFMENTKKQQLRTLLKEGKYSVKFKDYDWNMSALYSNLQNSQSSKEFK